MEGLKKLMQNPSDDSDSDSSGRAKGKGNNLSEMLESVMKNVRGQNISNAERLAFFPRKLREKVPVLRAEDLRKGDIFTVIIASIRTDYTSGMLDIDVKNWLTYFDMDPSMTSRFAVIKLEPVSRGRDCIDSADAIPKVEDALSSLKPYANEGTLRIISTGTGYPPFVYQVSNFLQENACNCFSKMFTHVQALTYMIDEWSEEVTKSAGSQRYVQLCTSGDTKCRDVADFGKWLLTAGKCDILQFFNTKDYHPFGSFSASQYKGVK